MVNRSLLIIVPTLNSHKVLVRLVNSLISQTFKDWRVIFIDGKSSLKHINYLKKLSKKIKGSCGLHKRKIIKEFMER